MITGGLVLAKRQYSDNIMIVVRLLCHSFFCSRFNDVPVVSMWIEKVCKGLFAHFKSSHTTILERSFFIKTYFLITKSNFVI